MAELISMGILFVIGFLVGAFISCLQGYLEGKKNG